MCISITLTITKKMKQHILSLLLLTTLFTSAQIETKHSIDIQREKCLDIVENQTTVGMINCEIEAAKLWDKQLNEYYKELLKLLNKEEQELLKESQRKWIEYRDKEFSFSSTLYNNLEGTMWRIVAAGRRCDIIRDRALELEQYINILTID